MAYPFWLFNKDREPPSPSEKDFPLLRKDLVVDFSYDEDTLLDSDGAAFDPTVQIEVVSVTIDSTQVWQPVLWPLLGLLPGVPDYDENKLKFLTQSASYAIQ
jgi:hypothetical protein